MNPALQNYVKQASTNLKNISRRIHIYTMANFVLVCFIVFLGFNFASEKEFSSPLELSYDAAKSPEPFFSQFIYFIVVTITSVGYGDYTPANPNVKCCFAVVVLFSSLLYVYFIASLSFLLEYVERFLVSLVPKTKTEWLDPENPKALNSFTKLIVSITVIVFSVLMGLSISAIVDGKTQEEAFYLAVISVTTIGYGDLSFKTVPGQLCASVWLPFCTIFVAMSYSFIAQLAFAKLRRYTIDKVLVRPFEQTNFDEAVNIPFTQRISELDYFKYMLKEMRLVTQNDLVRIRENYERYDVLSRGYIERESVNRHQSV